ncbi:MAG: hypothetical protein J4478_04025 [Candidatus Diapherotrites archaeon]|nr:hypothetical protein [Candidatus Diapherotrites archaeon]
MRRESKQHLMQMSGIKRWPLAERVPSPKFQHLLHGGKGGGRKHSVAARMVGRVRWNGNPETQALSRTETRARLGSVDSEFPHDLQLKNGDLIPTNILQSWVVAMDREGVGEKRFEASNGMVFTCRLERFGTYSFQRRLIIDQINTAEQLVKVPSSLRFKKMQGSSHERKAKRGSGVTAYGSTRAKVSYRKRTSPRFSTKGARPKKEARKQKKR